MGSFFFFFVNFLTHLKLSRSHQSCPIGQDWCMGGRPEEDALWSERRKNMRLTRHTLEMKLLFPRKFSAFKAVPAYHKRCIVSTKMMRHYHERGSCFIEFNSIFFCM